MSGHLIAPIVFVLVVLFLQLRVARPLSQWIDRRFFREAYSVDQVLVELSEQARTFTETEPLLRTITERISQTLHVERISFLMRQGKLFRLQYAQGIPTTLDVSLPENSSTMRALAIDRSPKRVFREHPDPWLALAAPAEITVLDRLDAELLLPLPGRANLIGVMALGPKLSEDPYSRSDRRLLSSVALQTGLAIENSTLVHHLAEESAQRQRIDREIEIARQVQEQLAAPDLSPGRRAWTSLDSAVPRRRSAAITTTLLRLKTAGWASPSAMFPAKGISCRSADGLHPLRPARAHLQRQYQPCSPRPGPQPIIYDSSTSNRFVTFFFGEYDPATRVLDYVNAGHNAPRTLASFGSWDG